MTDDPVWDTIVRMEHRNARVRLIAFSAIGLIVLLVVLTLGGIISVATDVRSLVEGVDDRTLNSSNNLEDMRVENRALRAEVRALRDQVRDLGGTPVHVTVTPERTTTTSPRTTTTTSTTTTTTTQPCRNLGVARVC